MSDAISLLGFYLAMVALLCSIFFTKLDEWYGQVRVAARLWSAFERQNPDLKELKRHHETALGLQSALPWRGFALVASFLILISVFSALLSCFVTTPSIPLLYIFAPGGLFELFFFVGSICLLCQGKRQIDSIVADIKTRR
jgi:hypothetical protein